MNRTSFAHTARYMTVVGLSALTIAGCSLIGNDDTPEIDPSLLPPQVEQTEEPATDASPSAIESASSGISATSEPIEETDLAHGDVIPSAIEDAEGWTFYPLEGGEYVAIEEGADDLPSEVLEDTENRLQGLRPVTSDDPAVDYSVRAAWLEDANTRLYESTGWRPVIVQETTGFALAEDKEPSKVYSFWVEDADLSYYYSQDFKMQDEAIAEANAWVEENEGKYIVVVSSDGGAE